jgi:hypothetical protein
MKTRGPSKIEVVGEALEAAGTAVFKVRRDGAKDLKRLERSLKILEIINTAKGRAVELAVVRRAKWSTWALSLPLRTVSPLTT